MIFLIRKYKRMKKIKMIFLLLLMTILIYDYHGHIPHKKIMTKRITNNKTNLQYYDDLFNLIEYDNYNISFIYNISYIIIFNLITNNIIS